MFGLTSSSPNMPAPFARILVYGLDPSLLQTRRLVLQHAGFDVTVATQLQTVEELLATQNFQLFILCHSLTLPICHGALALAHSVGSGLKNLILSTALSECQAGAGDAALSAFCDPQTLIKVVGQLSGQAVSTP